MGRQAVAPPRTSTNTKRPCKFFASGTCKNGTRCRFSHDGNGCKADGSAAREGRNSTPSPTGEVEPSKHGQPIQSEEWHLITPAKPVIEECRECVQAAVTVSEMKEIANQTQSYLSQMNGAYTLAHRALCDLQDLISRLESSSDDSRGGQKELTKIPVNDTTPVASKAAKVNPSREPAQERDDSVYTKSSRASLQTTTNANANRPPPQSSDEAKEAATLHRSYRPDESLDHVVHSIAPYLNCPANVYISDLRERLAVGSKSDLAEVFEECLEVLGMIAEGNATDEDMKFYHAVFDGVQDGMEEQCCMALLSATGAEAKPPITEEVNVARTMAPKCSKVALPMPKSDRNHPENGGRKAMRTNSTQQEVVQPEASRDDEEKLRQRLREERVATAKRKAAEIEAQQCDADRRKQQTDEKKAASTKLEMEQKEEAMKRSAALEAERKSKEEARRREKAVAEEAKRQVERTEREMTRKASLEAGRLSKAEAEKLQKAPVGKREETVAEEAKREVERKEEETKLAARLETKRSKLVTKEECIRQEHNESNNAVKREGIPNNNAKASTCRRRHPQDPAPVLEGSRVPRLSSIQSQLIKAPPSSSRPDTEKGTKEVQVSSRAKTSVKHPKKIYSITLYPTAPANSRGQASPLFEMIRDPALLPMLRSILPLEKEVAKLNDEVKDIKDAIGDCEKQITKVNEKYDDETKQLKKKHKTKEDWIDRAKSGEKADLNKLRNKLNSDLQKIEEERNKEIFKRSIDVAIARASRKRADVHSKYFARLDAQVEALDTRAQAIEYQRDEKLGVFRMEAIKKSKEKTLGSLEEAHSNNLAYLSAQMKSSLESVGEESDTALAKLVKKKENAVTRIICRKGNKLAHINGNHSSQLEDIENKHERMLAEQGLNTGGVLSTWDAIMPRMFQQADRRQIEELIDSEKDSLRKETQQKTKAVEEEASKAIDSVLEEYSLDRAKVLDDAERKKAEIRDSFAKREQKAVGAYTKKVEETSESFAAKLRLAEQERIECEEAVQMEFEERMAAFRKEQDAKMTEINAARATMQHQAREAYEIIESDYKQEMREISRYKASVDEFYDSKRASRLGEFEREEEQRKVETQKLLQWAETSDAKRVKDRDAEIAEQKAKIESLDKKLVAKNKELEAARSALSDVKGGQGEEAGFNISTSRDSFGNTLLISAAQMNDITTAELCLRLGASPHETNNDGFTAMAFAMYLTFTEMVSLLARHNSSVPTLPFDSLFSQHVSLDQHRVDWETQLRISEQAAIPPDTFLSSADDLDNDQTKMSILTPEESDKDFSCFESRLLDPGANTNFRRVILLEKNVYNWYIDPDRSATERSQFISLLRSLVPENEERAACHRRAVVGVDPQFEVLCAALDPSKRTTVVHFSPYVSSIVRGGLADIGILIWAVSSESKASYVKALVEQAEFKRNKIDISHETFLPHKSNVLRLGKDSESLKLICMESGANDLTSLFLCDALLKVHLIDLKSTSSWKSSSMTLYSVGVDSGDLSHLELNDVNFTPKTRSLESERILREQLFEQSRDELHQQNQLLNSTSSSMASNLFGGAGTGKTMLMIQKVASESPHKKLLVVARLPRLVSFIKSGVSALIREQSGPTLNCDYYTYNELMTLLARRCSPARIEDARSFRIFSQVHFSEITSTGSAAGNSFQQEFVGTYLTASERSCMARGGLEPLTLWTAIRVIKSHAIVSQKMRPLSRNEYLSLPKTFGLSEIQRTLAYNLYEKYREFCQRSRQGLWDEADRVLYCLKHGGSVFSEPEFVSWECRAYKWGEEGLIDEDGMPETPYYHNVYVDESQDYTDIDIALFIRLSAGVRSLFMGADPAQSVESGIRMRDGGINDVFHTCLPKSVQVKSVLQDLCLITNHRTHAQNLDLSQSIRRVLARSFCVPMTNENAISKGPIPETLHIKSLDQLGDHSIFKGANVVFVVPDEKLAFLRKRFLALGVKNDVFGVREAKGLEFEGVAVCGFFSHFENAGSAKEWQNCLRWLCSKKGIKETQSSERVNSTKLDPCDYLLTHPELEDQVMVLYTALTRARSHLYIIEDEETAKAKRRGNGSGLAEFAFRLLKQLDLVKNVDCIDGGETEMTPQEHNARGVLLVTKAIAASNRGAATSDVIEMFQDAADRFRPDKGSDAGLLNKAEGHLRAILKKRDLIARIKASFFNEEKGKYDLEGCFSKVLALEKEAEVFVQDCICDPFIVDEVRQLSVVLEDAFFGSMYWSRFERVVNKIKESSV